MNGKADIAFLLNPKAQTQILSFPSSVVENSVVTPPATPPPISLFRSLSPVVRYPGRATLSFSPTRKIPVTFDPTYEKHFSNVRCYSDENTRLPMLSLAAMHATNSLNSSSTSCPSSVVTGSSDHDEAGQRTRSTNNARAGKTRIRKTHTPPCQVEGCKNLAVSRGCCVRHGGGSRCTVAGCCKRAKLYQRCFQHGGFKTCTEPGCTKKAKRYGHCWSHGGGRICEIPGCVKVSTQGGLCWAHGGGNRCKLEGCSRRSYQKYGYYCVHHSKLNADAENTETSL
ncbi:putative WRKY transcription factor 19 [Phytophthora citrophthora]|uniref:WRKY transcription factor 19 n=1 Tax=Phytophthora citrophthora TaxID=4793 RepID=A0AAD9GRL5_9STRA|nr:putative WRKY transcription factor 19 [Phytophthora citrophthora]